MTQDEKDEMMQIAEHMSSKVQGAGIRIEFDSLTFPGKFAVLNLVPRTDGYTGIDVFLVDTFANEPEARKAANAEWQIQSY